MKDYTIRKIVPSDYEQVVSVYNSNQHFLKTHLGVDCVNEQFIADEVASMKESGFTSNVIVEGESQKICGVLDCCYGKEVYLSLLMLDAFHHGNGNGRKVYELWEQAVKAMICDAIRIDVVNDYPNHVMPFWKKLGFVEDKAISLTWGNKTSRAMVMRKIL